MKICSSQRVNRQISLTVDAASFSFGNSSTFVAGNVRRRACESEMVITNKKTVWLNLHLVELAREDRVISCFVEAGFSSRISADTIPEAISVLSLHHCILAVKAEIGQFCVGLSTLNVLEAVRSQPESFRQLFTSDDCNEVTAGYDDKKIAKLLSSF